MAAQEHGVWVPIEPPSRGGEASARWSLSVVDDPDIAGALSVARSLVLATLHDAPGDVRDLAALLTTEVLGNAILHASAPFSLAIDQKGPCIRVEVGDAGTMPPQVKRYGPMSSTGRGLRLLESLTEEWGWNPTKSGKLLWFELSKERGWQPAEIRTMQRPTEPIAVDPYPAGIPIVLKSAPVEAMIRGGECYDTMYREIRRHRDGGTLSSDLASVKRLLRMLDQFGTGFLGFGRDAELIWEDAVENDLSHVDVRFRLPPGSELIVSQFGEALDEAEGWCRTHLPHVAPTEEVTAVRRWTFQEVIRQCDGGEPRAWSHDAGTLPTPQPGA